MTPTSADPYMEESQTAAYICKAGRQQLQSKMSWNQTASSTWRVKAVGWAALFGGAMVFAASFQPTSVCTSSSSNLFVCERLPSGRADRSYVAPRLLVLDQGADGAKKELRLPNGSTSVADLKVTPDGRHAVLIHLVGHIEPPTESLKQRWMCGNAVTLIDVAGLEVVGTVLLDDRNRGAANPGVRGDCAALSKLRDKLRSILCD